GADELVDFTLPAASGTPEYIAPEQARGHDIDARGDLYSVGVVFYEMLTGRRPFEHSSAEDLLAAHVQDVPSTFAERGITHVPPALEAMVHDCLAKFPDQRPRDAAELTKRCEAALGKRLSASRRNSSVFSSVKQPVSGTPKQDSAPRIPSIPLP